MMNAGVGRSFKSTTQELSPPWGWLGLLFVWDSMRNNEGRCSCGEASACRLDAMVNGLSWGAFELWLISGRSGFSWPTCPSACDASEFNEISTSSPLLACFQCVRRLSSYVCAGKMIEADLLDLSSDLLTPGKSRGSLPIKKLGEVMNEAGVPPGRAVGLATRKRLALSASDFWETWNGGSMRASG